MDSQPKFPSSSPSTLADVPLLIEPSLQKYLSDLSTKEKLDLATDEYLFRPSVNEEPVVFESENPVSLASLDSINQNSPNKLKGKKKRSEEIARNSNKKTKTENKRPSGIFVGYAKLPSEFKEMTKDKRKYDVKKECIDEVASVEKKLWLEHYNQLCDKLLEVVREKCTGCQTDEPNQLVHELSVLASAKVKVDLCFYKAYVLVNWDEVPDNWYKKVLEMPIALNPETFSNFQRNCESHRFHIQKRLRKCSFLIF